MTDTAAVDQAPELELRPELVDLVAGTIGVDVAAVVARWGRLQELQERIEAAATAFRSVGMSGPADLVAGWSAELGDEIGWLGHQVRTVDLAREVAGVADARGISFAQVLALRDRPGPALDEEG